MRRAICLIFGHRSAIAFQHHRPVIFCERCHAELGLAEEWR